MFQGDPPVTLPIKLPLQVIGTLVHRRHYVGLRTTSVTGQYPLVDY